LWDVERRYTIKHLKGHQGRVNSIAFSPDGKTLASGGEDDTVKLWNMRTGHLLLTIQAHSGPVDTGSGVTFVTFAGDGKTLAIGDKFGMVKLWFAATPEEVEAKRNQWRDAAAPAN